MVQSSWHCRAQSICAVAALGLAAVLMGCGEVALNPSPESASPAPEDTDLSAADPQASPSPSPPTGGEFTAPDALRGLLGTTLVTNAYEATATTIYTWLVEYTPQGVTQDRPNDRRIETFDSSYRVNINGEPAVQDFGNPDSQGLWWPALPPKPTVDELEARQKRREVFAEPQISKSVQYALTFEENGEMITVATNYSVYREAVRGLQAQRPIQLAFGRQEAYIRQAEVQ